jgi:hypothetical protein
MLNQYGYTLGNPVSFSDPDGTEEVSTGDVVSAGFNAIAATGALLALTPASPALAAVLIAIGFAGSWGYLAYLIGESVNGGSAGFGPVPNGIGGSVNGGIGAVAPAPSPGCAPVVIGQVSMLRHVLTVSILLQILLGFALIRRRRLRLDARLLEPSAE